jgi:CheY-like chemotaxis protein
VEYASVRDEGMLLRFDHEVACADAPEVPLPEARQARAWIIDEDDAGRESLVKRLQRVGWATTTFGSLDAGEQRLRTMPAAQARPALVVATEGRSASAPALCRLVPLLPPSARCVLAVVAGSPALAHAPPDIEVQVLPFSPGDILRWTARLSGEADVPSGLTQPAPLTLTDRPRLLVVDDNEVNRIVATALSESLGYEVHLAHDGLQAIEACRKAPPVAVLMDLSMPRMDGFEASQRLRALQRHGDIPPFSIIAATADCTADIRQRCVAAGMDGYLGKPLLLPALAAELRRLCTGSVLAA